MFKWIFADLCAFVSLDACTGLQLKAKDGTFINGRTLEFGQVIDVSIAVVPRGYAFTGTTPIGAGMAYQSKCAALGAIAFNHPALMDGLNEGGLSVGIFYFPGFAEYGTVTEANRSKALFPSDFANWILTQFASIDEVKAALDDVIHCAHDHQRVGNRAALLFITPSTTRVVKGL